MGLSRYLEASWGMVIFCRTIEFCRRAERDRSATICYPIFIMNREIKFRVWNTKDGWYFPNREEPALKSNGELDCELGFYDCLVVEQHTGLKDKNGKEIYEGDYVKIANHRWVLADGQREEDAQYLVEWCGIGFDFNLLNGSFMQGCGRNSEPEYEVIGNIHEGIFKDND